MSWQEGITLLKDEIYLIVDRDRKDGCILARVIDSILKCGFHKRFFDTIHNTSKEIFSLVAEYDPGTIIINSDDYGMDEIVRYLKSHDTDDKRKYIVYEEHWL